MANNSRTFIFVDARVNHYQQLLAEVDGGAAIHVLPVDRDGIEAITASLQHHTQVEEIYLVAHGAPGCLYLGNSRLGLETLERYTSQLTSWFTNAVDSFPRLYLYGCNVAAGDAGEEFIQRLHRLTGAGIAASPRLVGHAELGGDWHLDFTVGTVTPRPLVSPTLAATYREVLSTGQDNFANAEELSLTESNTGSNVGATHELGEPIHDPNALNSSISQATKENINDSIWWKWTATTSGSVTVDTIGSTFNTVLAVYIANNPQAPSVSSLSQIAFNDNISTSNTRSRVTFNATEGQVYYFVVDGAGNAAGSIQMNLNTPPVIDPNQSFPLPENTEAGTIVGTLTANETGLTWTIVSGNTDSDGDGNGAFRINASTGQLIVNDAADLDFEGVGPTFNLVVSASDGLLSSQENVVVNLTDGADVPVITAISPSQTVVNEGTQISLDGTFNDPDAGDTHTVTIAWGDGTQDVVSNDNLSLPDSNGDKAFSQIRHTYQDDGQYTITVTVTDSTGAADSSTTSISVNNVAPVITQSDPVALSVNEDATKTVTLNATDAGKADTLTWSILNQPANGVASVSLTPNGTSQVISYDPKDNFSGTDTFEVQVRDPDGGVDTIRVNVSVLAQPDAPNGLVLSGSTAALDEGQTFTLSGSFSDPDLGDTFSVTIEWGDGSTATVLNNASIVNAGGGKYTFTTNHVYANDSGAGQFAIGVVVRDQNNLLTSATLPVDVNNVAPSIAEGASLLFSTPEDQPLTFVLNADDVADTSFTWTVLTQPPNGTVALNNNTGDSSAQSFTYTPDADFDGDDTFEIQVSDGQDTFTTSVFVGVNAINDEPTNLSLTPNVTVVNEGQTITLAGSFLDVDSTEVHTVTIDWGDGTDPTVLDSAALGAPTDNTYSFADLVHAYGDDGSFTVTMTVQDKAGSTATTSETITVNNVAPVLVNDQGVALSNTLSLPQINEDTPVTFPLFAQDPGTDDILQWSITTAPTKGTVTIQAPQEGQPQSFVYTPNTNVSGSDAFVVQVSDGDGGTDTVQILLDIGAVNDLPSLSANQFQITEGQPLVITQSILNATDIETFDSNLQFTITGLAAGDRFDVANTTTDNVFTLANIIAGQVTFIDNGDQTAPTFSISVQDANSGTTTVPGNITFTTVNDAPIITSRSFTVDEGGVITLNSNGVINLAATDEETDDATLTYTVTDLKAGTIRVNGQIDDTFTQAELDSGAVTFTHDGTETQPVLAFTVSDGQVSTSSTALITLEPQPDPPTFTNNNLTVTEGEATLVTLANFDASDPDTNVNTLRFVAPASIPGGQFQLLNLATGQYEATTEFTRLQIINEQVRFLHTGENTAPAFSMTVIDGSGLTDVESVNVTFNPVNDAPTFVNNILTISEGQSVVLSTEDLSATDEETTDLGTLSFTVDSITGGRFELTTAPGTAIFGFTQQQVLNSAVRFVDNGDEVKPAYTLSVSDGIASTSQAATVFFTNLNDPPKFLNNNLTVGEGQTVTLTTSNLDATDIDDADGGLSFTITGLDPNVGVFLVNGTENTTFTRTQIVNGLVQYQHKGSNTAPSYTVELTDGEIAAPVTGTPTVTFNATNDDPIIQVNSLTITEGDTVTLTATDLSATDEETNDADLQYTVVGSTDGTVPGGRFIDDLGNGINTFTQDDVIDGRVRFVHNGTETVPDYTLQVSDGTSTVSSQVTVNLTRINDAPEFLANQLSIDEGQTIPITTSNLNARDVDFGYDNNNLTFTIVGLDSAIGEFQLNGAPSNSFTLGDIINNRVQFVHKGSSVAPSYTVQLTDGTIPTPLTSEPQISFNAGNDLPVVQVNTLTIDEDEIVTLTTANLNSTDEETADEAIQYTVESVTGGRFLNASGTEIFSFTQGDVNNELVRFEHTGNEVAPTYTLGVSDGTVSVSSIAQITFNNLDDPPILKNNKLAITEGQTRLVTTNDIDASDVEDNDNTLTFTVGQLANGVFTASADFAGGEFQLKGTDGTFTKTSSFKRIDIINQRVRFVHGGLEITPAYAIQVTDSAGTDISSQANVTFSSLNDPPKVNVNRMIIDEDGVFVFNTDLADPDLSATDEETADGLLEYNVTSVSGGQFEEASAPGVEIFEFTQEQVDLGNILFVHNGDEAAPTYTLGVDDGSGTLVSSSGTVTFTPVNDAPVLGPNTLTLSEGDTVVLTTANLFATDIESDDNSLVFEITSVTGGYFEFTDGTLIANPTTPSANTFTLQDIILERVRFVQPADLEEVVPTYTVAVTDDDPDNPETTTEDAVVNFTAVNDAPTIVTNSLNIVEGGIALFSNGTGTLPANNFGILQSTDPEINDINLTYTISNVLGGRFELTNNPGTAVLTFTQGQVNSGQVRFVQNGTSTVPTYVVSVSDGSTLPPTVDTTPDVTFANVNDPPSITVNQLTITEGQTVVLNDTNIDYSDEDSTPAQITYTVTTGPAGGQFERVSDPGVAVVTFSQADIDAGAIQFVQDDTNTQPSYTLTLEDNDGATVSSAATVTFTPINDAPVVEINEISINEEGTVILNTLVDNLVSTDEEIPDGDLAYTVESVTNGQFEVVSAPGTAITSFTQAQVDAGEIQFVHDPASGEAAPTYSLRVADGSAPGVLTEGTVTFNRQNDLPVIGTNTLTIGEGETLTLSSAQLSASDEEDPDSSLSYAVAAGTTVEGGKFVLTSDPTQTAITTFTQAQIDSGAVQFIQDGTETVPSYTLTVVDSEGGTTTSSVTATLNTVNDAPNFQTNTLTISEGGTVVLNQAPTVNLATTDEESGAASLNYNVQAISGGRFELVNAPGAAINTFTQAQVNAGDVQFVHLGGEAAPTYELVVTDAGNESSSLAATINFSNQNDAPSFLASSLAVMEGETVTLNLSNINATDPDHDDRNLQYSITNITGGTFFLNGVALSNTDTPPQTFTRANINFGDLVFVDDGNETAPTFDITVTDPSGEATTITATTDLGQMNDVPVLNVNTIDIAEGERITLSAANLSASDEESEDSLLSYLITNVTGGTFLNETGGEIFTFSQAQLNAGNQIFFQHNGLNTAPTFSFTISDPQGGTTEAIAADINFEAVNNAPVFSANTLTIAEGQTVTLTTSNIQVSDSDTPLSQLEFTIDSVTNGTFTKNGVALAQGGTFTRNDLVFNRIAFTASNDGSKPAYMLTVSDKDATTPKTATLAATVTFNPTDDPPSFAANSFDITEDQDPLQLTASNLNAADEETTNPSSFNYLVTNLTGGAFVNVDTGQSVVTFSQQDILDGRIFFEYGGGEVAPTFSFTLTDAGGNQVTQPGVINFTAVDDAPVLEANNFAIAQGASLTLSTTNLSAGDPDTSAPNLTFTITDLVGVTFNRDNDLNGTADDLAITSFTQQDLVDGKITLVDDGNNDPPAFNIVLADATTTLDPVEAAIAFVDLNDPPSAVTLTLSATTIAEGSSVTLNGSFADIDSTLHTATIAWGDGSTSTVDDSQIVDNGDGTFTLPAIDHVYTDDGDFTVTVALNDGNSVTEQTTALTVTDVPPVIALTAAGPAEANSQFILTIGDPLDPGNDPIAEYLVNWGDGTQSTVTQAGNVSKVYKDFGLFDITVTATDDDGKTFDVGTVAADILYPITNFDGNDSADLLWRSSTGENVLWLLTNGNIDAGVGLPTVSPSFVVEGIKDFNNDGSEDIFWRDQQSGANILWLFDGATLTQGVNLLTVTPDYDLAAITDFNNDGSLDLFWRQLSTGNNVVWHQQNGTPTSATTLPTVDPGFILAGTNDFNGDSFDDLLWRNTSTGGNFIWFMNDVTPIGSQELLQIDPSFDLAGISDFNSDGNGDLLWRSRTNGETVLWLLDNNGAATAQPLPTVDVSYTIEGVTDFNGDNQTDILWRSASSGDTIVWTFDGATLTGTLPIADPPPGWDVIV
jgi:hypothetical protein